MIDVQSQINRLYQYKYRSIATQQIVSALQFIANAPIPMWRGADTSIITPSQTISAQYAIVSVSDLQTSHDPTNNFAVNPLYPANCQQRDYHADANEQAKVIRMAEKLNPDFLLAQTPSPTDGAPIITPQGIVLGGNGRVMAMKIASREAIEHYQKRLNFGHMIAKMPHDFVLVRIVDVDMTRCALYSNILNTNFTQKQSHTQETVSLARQLTQEQLRTISELFEESQSETFAQFASRPAMVKKLIEILRYAGVITSVNVAQFTEDGATLTDYGKLTIERILLGLILTDKRYIDSARQYSAKILRALPALIRIQSMQPEYNIIPDILRALQAEHERSTAGQIKSDFLAQISPFDDPLSDDAVFWWNTLDKSINAPDSFVRTVRVYVQQVEYNTGGDSFGFAEPMSKKEIIAQLQKGRGLGDDVDVETILQMLKDHAEQTGSVALFNGTAEEAKQLWNTLFAEKHIQSPVGTVKIGDNQFEKLSARDRLPFLPLTWETIQDPTVALLDQEGILFLRLWKTNEENVYFFGVSYNIRGIQVVVSLHSKRESQVERIIGRSKVLYAKKISGRTALNDSVQSLPRVPCRHRTDALSMCKFTTDFVNFKTPTPTLADKNKISLQKAIRNEPYLQAKNCTDIADIDYALERVAQLVLVYGDSPKLSILRHKLREKRKQFEAMSDNTPTPTILDALASFYQSVGRFNYRYSGFISPNKVYNYSVKRKFENAIEIIMNIHDNKLFKDKTLYKEYVRRPKFIGWNEERVQQQLKP